MIEKVKHKGLALLVLAGAQFMVVLDATIVNVALPSIQEALNFESTAQLQWLITSYTLLFGGFLLLGGRLADLYGRRKIFMTGLALFAGASLLAGLAQTPAQMIVFRGLQGLGGALLAPSALSLVLSIFAEGKERNKALGIWGGVAAGGGAVGLLLGGILTQYVDWRWIFFINVPIAVFLAYMAMAHVPKSLPGQKSSSLDLVGAVTVTSGLMLLVYGIVKAPEQGWLDANTLVYFAAAFTLLAIFVWNEMRVKHPLMPLGIFKNRNVSTANLMQIPIAGGMMSLFFYLSIYMQQILQYSPLKTGMLFLPFTATIGITAAIVSKKIADISPRTILMISPLLVASGLLYFSRIPVDGNYLIDILPGIVLMASGMGATFVALTLAATSGVKQQESGLVSGLLNTSQQLGGAIGLAVLSAISTVFTSNALAAEYGNPQAIPNALVQGFHIAFIIGAALAVTASIIAFVGFEKINLAKMTSHTS